MWILLGAGFGRGRCVGGHLGDAGLLRLWLPTWYSMRPASSLWEITSVYPPIYQNHQESIQCAVILLLLLKTGVDNTNNCKLLLLRAVILAWLRS